MSNEFSATSGLTSRLATYAATCRFADLSDEARGIGLMQIYDSIACILAGVASPRVAGSIALSERFEGRPDAARSVPVIGTDRCASAPAAAFAMAAACHALEYDDGNREGSIHPGTVVVPTALAVAYLEDARMDDMLDAILAGYEVCVVPAEIMNPGAMKRGFQPTPVTGTLGAAAAAGRILGLGPEAMESVLGIAGSASGGTFAYLAGGGDIKKLHPANAARAGVMAAYAGVQDLARGPKAVLEGPLAIFHAYAGLDDVVGGHPIGGPSPALCRSYVKPYPCCRHVHSAIEALMLLVCEHNIAVDRIDRIEVETYAAAMAHAPLPWDTFEIAQLSFPYLMAVAAAHRRVTIADFEASYREDSALAALAGRVTIKEAAELTARYPAESPAHVRLTTIDGRVYDCISRFPPGSREAPMTDAAFAAKFAECVGRAPALRASDVLLANLLSLPADTPVRSLVDKRLTRST